MKDVYFKYGEVRRYNKRLDFFGDELGTPVLNQFKLEQASQDKEWFLYFTNRDIMYRDRNAQEYVYITPQYSEGTVTATTTLTGQQFSLDFLLPSGESLLVSAKAGDYIRLGSTEDAKASDTWYLVTDVTDADSIVCDGVLPTGYDPADVTGGDDYVIRQVFSGLTTDYWTIDNFNETLIATNNGVDYPIYWTGTGQVANMTEEFKCKALSAFGGRVVASHLISGGTSFPKNRRWSGLDDYLDWGGTGSDAGEVQLIDLTGGIAKTIVYRDFLFTFSSDSIMRSWAVVTDDIFNNKIVRADLGTKAAHSFMVYRDVMYFYCTQDSTFRRFDGFYDNVLSTGIQNLARSINVAKEHLIQAYFVNNERQLMWAIPYLDSSTLSHILISDLDMKDQPWSLIEMDTVSFGTYTQGVDLEWDSLPYDEWASWDWDSWLGNDDAAETRLDMVADGNGKVYQLNATRQDDGEDYTSYIVFNTDMADKKKLQIYKRFLKVQFYMRNAPTGTMTLEVKRDNESEWITAGTINLNAGRDINVIELPVDFLAKSFQIKLSTEYDFQLIGMIFWYIEIGDR